MRVCSVALAFALPLCLRADAAESDENMLQNPSLELGEREPANWHFNRRRSECEISWDKSRAYDGDASAVICSRSRAETGNVYQAVTFDPPLEPGSRIEFSAMAACENMVRHGPRIIVTVHDEAGGRQSAAASGIGGTHGFARVAGVVVAEVKTKRVTVYLCNYGVGKTWWDDAHLSVDRAAATRIVARPKSSKPV
jgi:hypothetical protein